MRTVNIQISVSEERDCSPGTTYSRFLGTDVIITVDGKRIDNCVWVDLRTTVDDLVPELRLGMIHMKGEVKEAKDKFGKTYTFEDFPKEEVWEPFSGRPNPAPTS
jgi:hypothetical protein